MNSIYSLLAPFYDAINGSVDYEKWADFYVSEFRRYEKTKTTLVLDLGCGTGSMTLALARRGYDMTGVDNCPEMLDAAQKRSMREGFYGKILYLCQDMTAFELYGTVDAVVCCLDGMNHLTTTADFRKTLSLVHNYLAPDGLFLFDLNSEYKFRTVYGDRAYLYECGATVCAWQNAYREKSGMCDFSITLFTRERNGLYRRSEEWQREKMYKDATVRRLLRESGFELLSVAQDINGTEPTDTSLRLYYTARAIKPQM